MNSDQIQKHLSVEAKVLLWIQQTETTLVDDFEGVTRTAEHKATSKIQNNHIKCESIYE